MIKIATSELKMFFTYASPIKDSNLLPIYAYLKIVCEGDTATIYKSNGNSYVACQVKAEFKKNITLIVDEKKLSGLAQFAQGKNITLTLDGKNIKMTDGIKNAAAQNLEDNFPETPARTDEETFQLSSDFLSSLYIASNHIMNSSDKANRPWSTYVFSTHINKLTYVGGFNGVASYFKSFKGKFPVLALEKFAVDAIARFGDGVQYSVVKNYDFFDAGNVAYGFIQTNGQPADLSLLLAKFTFEKSFTIDRAKLLNFCQFVIKINTSNVQPEIRITSNGKKSILLDFKGMGDNEFADEELVCDKKNFDPEEFLFIPEQMIIAIKDLSCEKLKMSYIQYHFLFTTDEDKDYVGAIMQLAKLPAPVVQK